jgi:DNA repair ATPase RecN
MWGDTISLVLQPEGIVHKRFRPAALILASLLAALSLGGQNGLNGIPGPYHPYTTPTTQTSTQYNLTIAPSASQQPRMTQQQIDQDQSAVTAAEAIYLNAKEDLQTIQTKYRHPFELTQPWIEAQAHLKQDQADLQSAQQAVINNLSSNPDYIAAITDRDKTAADLSQARASGDTSPDDLGPLAYAAMAANAKVGKLQDAAQAADPTVMAASQKVADDGTVVDQLNAQYQQMLATKDDWTAAHNKWEDSAKALDNARAKLAADARLLPAGAVPPPAVHE